MTETMAIYEEVHKDLPLATGDLYASLPEFGNPDSAGIVLTPMCDLVQGKVEWVKLAQAIPFKTYLQQSLIPLALKDRPKYRGFASAQMLELGETLLNQSTRREINETLSFVKTIAEFMRNVDPKKSAHYYLPGKDESTQGYLVSFSFVLSVRREELQKRTPLLRLQSPWREQLLSRYISHSARVGTPDYPEDGICEAIKAFFPELTEEQIRRKL
jgi:hypothetical protein